MNALPEKDWLGLLPDSEVARRFGKSRSAIQELRTREGIPACYPRGRCAALFRTVYEADGPLTASEIITRTFPNAKGDERRYARRCLSYLARQEMIFRRSDGRYERWRARNS